MKNLLTLLLLITTFLFSLVNKTSAQQPTITSFSPLAGPVGTPVTINGTNFTAINTVTIGGVNAVIISNNGTILKAMVMPGAATGIVSIKNSNGTATGNSNYIVTPTIAPTLEQATLTGTGSVA